MPGLSHDDPRFENAVSFGVALFARNPGLNPEDLEDLAQEIRIALLDHGGAAPKLCAKYTAVDWWRGIWGRKDEAGEYHSSALKGRKRMELLARWSDLGEDHAQAKRLPAHHRGQSFRRALEPVSLALDLALSTESAPDHVLTVREVRRLLARLPRRDALVLTLRYLHGLELQEMAERMGICDSRVCQLLPVALERCRVLATGGSLPKYLYTENVSKPARKRAA